MKKYRVVYESGKGSKHRKVSTYLTHNEVQRLARRDDVRHITVNITDTACVDTEGD